MKNKLFNRLALIVTFGLFLLNFTPVFAQVMEIEIVGGGYRLKGPCLLEFPTIQAAFIDQESSLNIRNITGDCDPGPGTLENPPYLEITDENGGNEFQVQVTIDLNEFISGSGQNDINNITIQTQNKDEDTGTSDIETTQGSANHLFLDPNTDIFATIDSVIPLGIARGTGEAPGQWRIFPLFKINIPSGTPPDTYSTILSFTII